MCIWRAMIQACKEATLCGKTGPDIVHYTCIILFENQTTIFLVKTWLYVKYIACKHDCNCRWMIRSSLIYLARRDIWRLAVVYNIYFHLHARTGNSLTYWGRVTHNDNRQSIVWTNAGILLIGPLGSLQWNLNRNSSIFFNENVFENVVWKIAAILSLPQCVKTALTNPTFDCIHNQHTMSHDMFTWLTSRVHILETFGAVSDFYDFIWFIYQNHSGFLHGNWKNILIVQFRWMK